MTYEHLFQDEAMIKLGNQTEEALEKFADQIGEYVSANKSSDRYTTLCTHAEFSNWVSNEVTAEADAEWDCVAWVLYLIRMKFDIEIDISDDDEHIVVDERYKVGWTDEPYRESHRFTALEF